MDVVVDYVLRFCTSAWTVHDYSTGGSDCLEYFADMVEDSDHLYVLLDEVGVDCGDSCEAFGEVLSRRLRELAERKRFGDEFKVFDEFSRVLHMLQQVMDDVNRVFDAVSQELYRIYKECSGDDLKRRVELLIESLRKSLGRGSEAVASGYE
jgi:hypothetical protein